MGFYVSKPLVYETFASAGIPFERVDTDPGLTMEDCANISARIGVQIVKPFSLATGSRQSFTSKYLRGLEVKLI